MSRTASSHSDSFTYPADSQQEPVDDEDEFVYPTTPTHDPAPVHAPPLEALDVSDIVTSSASPSAAGSQEAVPLEQPNVTESPSSSTALHQSSPPAPSNPSPSPSPSPSPPTQTHASPAQLEALYAAASSGDLPLLQGIIRNASQTGNVEPFSLVNDASSRTGLTALHASASRGYLEIVKWRKMILISRRTRPLTNCTVVESCGAIPDLEDKEGEVTNLIRSSSLRMTNSTPDFLT